MNKRNTRDLGLRGGGAGKGDSPRYSNNENWRKNYDEIDWGHSHKTAIDTFDHPPYSLADITRASTRASVLPAVPSPQPCLPEGNCDCPTGQGSEASAD